MKRILSVLLCLMMFISLATPAAYAMDIPVSSDMGLSMDDIYFGDGANVVYNEDGSMTITSSDKSTLMPSELMGGVALQLM